MSSLVPAVRGAVKIEVIKEGKVVKSHQTPNTLVLEAPKILLGNIIGPMITGAYEAENFTNSDSTRPVISAGGQDGPSAKLSVNYLKLGYVEGTDPVESVTVSATDYLPSGFGSTLAVTKLLTDAVLGEYSVQFVCAFEVDSSVANRKYYEAALLCPALKSYVSIGMAMPDPEEADSGYDENDQVMFAHQTHTAIQASAGSTIKYTWTITMQEPSDS
jgi:hypothetical protein